MSFASYANQRPPRCSFTNLRTAEVYEMPFTPETFTETLSVNYSRLTPLGLSHEVLQYSHTGNHTIDGIEFFFRAEKPDELELIHAGRRFLLSLGYAPRGATSIRDGGPPRVLFYWPRIMSLTTVITGLQIVHEKFNIQGLTTTLRCRMSFEEIRDSRLYMEDVASLGTLRGGSEAGENDGTT